MKKLLFVIVLVVIIGTMLSACKSNKPPCPAYKGYKNSSIEVPVNLNDRINSIA